MHYCEVTPRNNKGIVHLKTVLFLKDYKLKFDRDSKFLYCIDCFTGESVQISPLYEYKLVEDCKNRLKNCYEFKIALKIIGDHKIDNKEKNLYNLKNFEKEGSNLEVSEHKDLIKLLYLDDKGFNLLKGFINTEKEFKEVKLSNSSKIFWTKFQISCRDLIILDDNLLSIDIRNYQGIYCLIFRIGIKIDKKLDFLDLKVTSLSCFSGIDSFKGTKNLLIRCKRCGTELDSLSDFSIFPLPSDLYINSIGSIYCEECQDNLTNSKTNSLQDKVKLSNKHKILYISDETVTVNHSPGGKHTLIASNKDCNTNSSLVHSCVEEFGDKEGRVVFCSNCKEVVGSALNNSISYLKNRISGISEGVDIFWRFSEYIEFVESIQYSDRIQLAFGFGEESIEIIKATREPDTFIFINNNPVVSSRILFKIENNNNKQNKNKENKEETNTKNKTKEEKDNKDKQEYKINENKNKEKRKEKLDSRLFEHIKYLLLLFSHDQDNSEWIASLLPQI